MYSERGCTGCEERRGQNRLDTYVCLSTPLPPPLARDGNPGDSWDTSYGHPWIPIMGVLGYQLWVYLAAEGEVGRIDQGWLLEGIGMWSKKAENSSK